MGPRAKAECIGELQTASDSSCESHFDPCPRHEEPITIPCDAVQQTPKKANPRKVICEPLPLSKASSENAQEVQSKQSKHLEDEAQKTNKASAHDRNNNTNIADKHVNGQQITRDGNSKIDIPEYLKLLLEREDEFGKAMDYSFSWSKRPLELFYNIFCGLWKPQSFFVKNNERMREKAKSKDLESLPADLQENIFQRLPFKELTQAKAVSKSCKDLIQRDAFQCSRGSSGEGAFTALNFFIKHGEWQCTANDLHSKEWQRLPTLACLPSPNPNLFQEYLICGHGGLICANVSKSSHKEELVVFNILTGEKRALPPLHYSRNLVLLHIWVDSITGTYKVIAAGSASSLGAKDLSQKIEVYDSLTLEWKIGNDIPGPKFGLNEFQIGVCLNGVLYFVMFLDGDGLKGIIAFDIEKGEWLEDRFCVVPFSLFCNTLQLLESFGMLYLFSEQERDGVVKHCIDVVELWDSDGKVLWQLRTVVSVTKSGGRGLLVYPEYTCVPFGIGKLCVFNTINCDGVVYDIDNGMQCQVLQPPLENQRGENFFCLNPISFILAPNFASKP